MDTNDQYFECLCRTCMNELVEATSYDGNTKPQQQWQSIFDRIEECGAFRIAELLTNAVPQIEVEPSDELPKRICSKCLQQLLTVYRFQQMCIKSEQIMRQQVSKNHIDLKIPTAAMKSEIGKNDADSYHFTNLQSSSTQQNLENTSIQEPLESTEQVVKSEAAETSDCDIDKLLEDCRDAEGNLSEFVKNEPIEDDEPGIEYSDDETTISAISEKGERLSIELEEEQINEANVKANRIIHGEDKLYECPYCPQRFLAKSSYYRHKANHEGVETQHVCEICGKSIRKGRLKEHKRIHSDKKAHKCDPCDKRSVEKHKCPRCPQRFSKYSNMLQHKAIHKGVKINCDICGKSIRKDHLKTHKRIHSGEKPHKCHLCEKSFIQMTTLRFHIRTHTGEKPYKCKYCERSYFQNSDLMRHMRLHLGYNVHRCELCPLAFPAMSELRIHFTTHKNEDPETRERNMKALKEAEAKLEQQQLEMKAKKNVKANRITHGEDKRYECPYCPRRFNVKSSYYRHKANHEDVETQHVCEICGKSIRKGRLKEHKRIHSDKKAHKCDLCEKSFDKMSDLRRHMRKHTGKKPYKCKYCERSFSHCSSRLKHMRLHLGNNVHRCELCPLAFPAASELRAHFTTHKNEDPGTRERNMKALKEAEAELEIKAKE